MSHRRKITLAIVLTVAGLLGYVGYKVVYVVRHIPEAYSAWDTGTLLVEFMKSHENRWPSSWDDLVLEANRIPGNPVMFRGNRAGDTNYAASLRKSVAIDWKFDPATGRPGSPVTRLDGSKFPVLWTGAEPNQMIREYLKAGQGTNRIKVQ